jgi:osmotically-inducible protein OsmY
VAERVYGVKGVANDIEVKMLATRTDPNIAKDATVTLTGNLHSWNERNEAGRAAWAAPGGSQVENLIHVIP